MTGWEQRLEIGRRQLDLRAIGRLQADSAIEIVRRRALCGPRVDIRKQRVRHARQSSTKWISAQEVDNLRDAQ